MCKTYQKYCNPGQADVVKRDRTLERIRAPFSTIRVVLVPIHARRVRWLIIGVRFCSFVAYDRSVAVWRKVTALVHAAVSRRRANVVQFFRKLVVKRYAA